MLFVLKTNFPLSWIQKPFIYSSTTSAMMFVSEKKNTIELRTDKNIWKSQFKLKSQWNRMKKILLLSENIVINIFISLIVLALYIVLLMVVIKKLKESPIILKFKPSLIDTLMQIWKFHYMLGLYKNNTLKISYF